MTQRLGPATSRIIILLLLVVCAISAAADPVTEVITTPHWEWPGKRAERRVVYLVNSAATREPAELAQRFPIRAITIPVSGNDYGNSYDEPALLAALATSPDALVVAASQPWRDLSPEANEAIRSAVENGLTLICLERNGASEIWPDQKAVEAATPAPDDTLHAQLFAPRDRSDIRVSTVGRGRVIVCGGYRLHWTFHAAFIPQHETFTDFPVAAELAYTQIARVIYWATGDLAADAAPTATAESRWYSRYGEPIRGPRPGLSVRQWWDATGFGVQVVTTPGASPLAALHIAPDQLTWTPQDAGTVFLRLQDADGRLLADARWPAAAGTGSFSARSLVTQTCVARIALEVDGQVLDEQRLPLTLAGDFSPMPVIVWGRQTGGLDEQWQYPRLRQLGVNAVAVVGRKPEIARAAAEAGLRVVPTNVFVPSERTLANVDDAAADLASYVTSVKPLTPLGWSLADEPSGVDLLEWRERAAAIIAPLDAAPVGYCGVWLKPPMDIPATLAALPFLEAYSPRHLYTPNLWLGAERDLLRDFRHSDSLITAWTHYVGSRDNEPYARTAPWLWLFDGLDGLSYFCSTRHFGILEDDLRTAPDSRWWSEEVQTLHRGIATQIRLATRDTGGIRLVYTPENGAAETLALGLNRANIPYRWISLTDLEQGLDADANLLILAGLNTLSDNSLAKVETFVRTGGRLAVVGGGRWGAHFRGLSADVPPERDDTRFAGVPAETSTPVLRGVTNGAIDWQPAGATVVAQFTQLGIATDATDAPEFVQALFAMPAISRHTHGTGTVWNIAITPDSETLPTLFAELGASPIATTITRADGTPSPATYLYPMTAGSIQMIGVIQDYTRVTATADLRENDRLTQAGIAHGKQRWDSALATLHLPADAHLYDVRRGRYLGRARDWSFDLTPGRPELLAALPYSVDGLQLAAPATVAAGTELPLVITLQASAAPGPHVVHLSAPELSSPVDITLTDGRGDIRIPVPYGLSTPVTITVRDTISGQTATHTISITGDAPAALADRLPRNAPAVLAESRTETLPAGAWEPVKVQVATAATAAVQELRRQPLRQGRYAGKQHVLGGFSLSNSLTRWQASYMVCDDPSLGLPDPRQVAAPYLPGLGFKRPAGHLWYYNGYLTVHLDEFHATAYVLQDIRVVPDPLNARVDCSWETPAGSFVLRSTLTPDGLGLYQELIVRPTRRFQRLRVGFRSYPAGYDKDGAPWIQVAQEGGDWAFIGDKLRDRAYGQGLGPGGIMVLANEWTEHDLAKLRLTRDVDADARPLSRTLAVAAAPGTLTKPDAAAGELDELLGDLGELTATPDATPAQLPELRVHWCLWMLPDMGNAEALQYLQAEIPASRDRLRTLYDTPQPR